MWTDSTRSVINDRDPYTAPDGTQYPGNFPKEDIPGLSRVIQTPAPDPALFYVAGFSIDADFRQVWDATPKSAEAIAAALISAVERSVQDRLDAFARTRNYDGILSAASYATSKTPRFAAEGQYCVDARDAHWAACYSIMADVQAGVRPMPTVDDVLAEMPALAWPA